MRPTTSPTVESTPHAITQGLTLHFSAQRKHVRVGYVGCMIIPQSIRQGDTGRCGQNGLG
jgi:hypothetical protein